MRRNKRKERGKNWLDQQFISFLFIAVGLALILRQSDYAVGGSTKIAAA